MNRPQRQLSLFLGFSLFLLSFSSGCGYFSPKKNADYQALEDRVGQLEKFSQEQQARVASPPAPKPEPKAEPAKAQPTPALVSSPAPEEKKAEIQGNMEELYPQARAGYLEEEYETAIKIFSYLLKQYPNHPLSPNARYWLGECFYGQKQYKLALPEFERVVSDFPKSAKAPEAQLKIAFAYSRLGDGKKAMESLKALLKKYPQSSASGMVRQGKTIFRPEDAD
jgi:tol-pal system protein YbgF